jgi:hypothetical protein
MKRCPKCSLVYFDNALDFCLEDGAKLVAASNSSEEMPTVTKSNKPITTTDKTVSLPFSGVSPTIGFDDLQQQKNKPQTILPVEAAKTNLIKEKVTVQTYKILEVAPIVLSLTHNWWQWIHLNNQYYSSLSGFLVSANFLMWLLLLLAGATVSFFALKKCENKAFAYTSFVILAVNFILFLVPKR